jgi:hypothetical protein
VIARNGNVSFHGSPDDISSVKPFSRTLDSISGMLEPGCCTKIDAHGNDACPEWNVCSAGELAPSQVAPPGSSSSSCPAISPRAFTTSWPSTFSSRLYVKPTSRPSPPSRRSTLSIMTAKSLPDRNFA